MFVLGINGSPRKNSNSELMLEFFIKGVKTFNVENEIVLLRNHVFNKCCGNDKCFYENFCVYNDAFTLIHEKMLKADLIVLSSPSYFNNVSGLLKDFMDRTNPFCRPPLYEGKKIVFLCVGGNSIESVKKLEEVLKDFARIHRMVFKGSILAVAEKELELKSKPKILEMCCEFGRKTVFELLNSFKK
jgi:multimeric flavodoxin WrbA